MSCELGSVKAFQHTGGKVVLSKPSKNGSVAFSHFVVNQISFTFASVVSPFAHIALIPNTK